MEQALLQAYSSALNLAVPPDALLPWIEQHVLYPIRFAGVCLGARLIDRCAQPPCRHANGTAGLGDVWQFLSMSPILLGTLHPEAAMMRSCPAGTSAASDASSVVL